MNQATNGSAAAFEFLFRPFEISGLSLRNRLVMSPMTVMTRWSPDEVKAVTNHFLRRAEGGVGLIMSGATLVDHLTAGDTDTNFVSLHGEASLAAWTTIVKAVRDVGVPMMPQLFHFGGWRDVMSETPAPATTPSGLGPMRSKVGEPATQAEIDEVIAGFVRSAVNAKQVGFAGVELAGAHGYLIDQFFWEERNVREDKYGGSIENRARFAAEIVQAIRAATGPKFPIAIRLSEHKRDDNEARPFKTPEELQRFLAVLIQAGVDAFDCSTWRFWRPLFPESDPTLSFAGWVKKLSNKPTMTVGGIGLKKTFVETVIPLSQSDVGGFDKLMEAMLRGDFDLAVLGRALLADPDWPHKVREGRIGELKPYVQTQSSLEFSAHEYRATS